jgi:hypothetical protein
VGVRTLQRSRGPGTRMWDASGRGSADQLGRFGLLQRRLLSMLLLFQYPPVGAQLHASQTRPRGRGAYERRRAAVQTTEARTAAIC